MDQAFEPLVKALDAAGAAIIAISPGHQPTLLATHGWNQPALNLAEIAGFATRLAGEIRDYGLDDISDTDRALVTDYSARVDAMRSNMIPQFWGGNGPQSIPAYVETLAGMRAGIQHLIPKNRTIDPRAASRLARRLDRMSADLDEIVIDRDSLSERMRQINDAYEAAESLPEDLASLKKARDEVSKLSSTAKNDSSSITKHESDASKKLSAIKELADQAEKLVAQCEEAYRVTTSKGLAGAFDQRATRLTRSMQLWVLALVIALGLAAYFGGQRVALLSENLANADPKWGVIWLNFALSLLSVGAPLWFAWVATKQIGQRFRLAEDYAYKASIAKAYEGYRREAANLDPEFSARLFGSSLTRLEEAPLRLMEATSHGSPLHELLNSSKVQDAINLAPEFREKVANLIAEAQTILPGKLPKSAPVQAEKAAKED
ncbi:hypothetical protein EJO68_04195 [Variovorax atrisoli]|uniref:hypothetical protein n=1 Tax=Variovorax atrisoli TaxID=3394203 RepID=UPI000F7E1113|nr:hypothetical protein [Variovorax sp. 369]RTD98580.1 hypothetical protein EJO68_04195 [Variovorax sp. 369]